MDVVIRDTRGFHHDLERGDDPLNDQRHALDQQHQRCVQRVLDVVKARDVLFGHHHDVPWIDGVNREQDHEVRILVDPMTG